MSFKKMLNSTFPLVENIKKQQQQQNKQYFIYPIFSVIYAN